MKRLKLAKTFYSKLNGVPDTTLTYLGSPDTVALVPGAPPFVKLKLLVRENDVVQTGTPLLEDKRDPMVQWVSPGGGTIEAIVRGPRRVVKEIIIRLDSDSEPADTFAPIPSEIFDGMPREALVELLKQRGVWSLIRQFPFMDIPDATSRFPMAVISLHTGDPFAPSPSVYLKDQQASFLHGLAILEKLSEKLVVTTPQQFLSPLKIMGLSHEVTHVTQNQYPAGDPGVILYQIKKSVADNRACTMAPQDLIAMGSLFLTGQYYTKRIYAVGGTSERPPAHYMTRMGTPLTHLLGDIQAGRGVITGGLFTGELTRINDHMGIQTSSAIVMDAVDKDAFFGFAWPGRDLLSESHTFLSSLGSASLSMDATLHGEERACVNCGWCDKKCPVDLLPQFIMKAAGAGEMDEALSLGLLDCTGCGLCTFVCPSKIDLAAIMDLAAQTCYRDRMMS